MSDSRQFSSLANDEKDRVRARLHRRQGDVCFLCERAIVLAADEVEGDHIDPLAQSGLDDDANWALMHAHCNESKGAKDLQLARVMARFRNLSDEHEGQLYAQQVLESVGGASRTAFVDVQDRQIKLRYDVGAGPVESTFDIMGDPGGAPFDSFFGLLPVEVLYHDAELNPRKILSIDGLLQEFYRRNPQLHVALGRISAEPGDVAKVLVFDGQHKMAAQIMLGRREIPLRVFIDPDTERLKAVNRRAHKELRQVEFFRAVIDTLGDDVWGKEFARYLEDGQHPQKSESAFVESLPADRRSEMKRMLKEHLRARVANNQEPPNRFFDFVEKDTSRATDKPVAYYSVQQAMFKLYLDYHPNTQPLSLEDEEQGDARQIERLNLTHFMNMLAEELLEGCYDPGTGIRRLEERVRGGEPIPVDHLRSARMFRKSLFQAWSEVLYEAIAFFLRARGLIDASMEQTHRVFWAKIGDEEWRTIRSMVSLVRDHQLWLQRQEQHTRWFGETNVAFFQEWFRNGIVEGERIDGTPLDAAYLQRAVGATSVGP